MNQFNIIKIYTIFTQQQDTKSAQVPIYYKPETLEHIWDIKQGAKISWPKVIEIIQSLLSYYCGIIVEISIKRYLKITQTFSRAIWHLPREIFGLAIENLNKAKRLKKSQMVIAEWKHLKWEINIKDTLKTPCIWELNVHFKWWGLSEKS